MLAGSGAAPPNLQMRAGQQADAVRRVGIAGRLGSAPLCWRSRCGTAGSRTHLDTVQSETSSRSGCAVAPKTSVGEAVLGSSGCSGLISRSWLRSRHCRSAESPCREDAPNTTVVALVRCRADGTMNEPGEERVQRAAEALTDYRVSEASTHSPPLVGNDASPLDVRVPRSSDKIQVSDTAGSDSDEQCCAGVGCVGSSLPVAVEAMSSPCDGYRNRRPNNTDEQRTRPCGRMIFPYPRTPNRSTRAP